MTDARARETPAQRIDRVAAQFNITMRAEFVPFSKSRNAKEKTPSLNWRITLKSGARDILTTDYMQGYGHAPAYNASIKALGARDSVVRHAAIAHECETGALAVVMNGIDHIGKGKKLPAPELRDVLHSLLLDSDVIDHPTFESWASEFGYDTDSRSAETIYRACLETALKLRSGLGETALAQLREACQDY